MTEPQRLTADIFLDADVPSDREQSLVESLAALGVTGQAKVVPVRRALGQLHWLVLIALPLQAFLSTVGRQAAEDAYQGFRKVVRGLLTRGEPEAKAPRPIVFQDTSTGIQVVLEPDLPDDGYEQLLRLDLSQFRLGPVLYDRTQGRWRSQLDEARA
jgi:hypothetical protein